MSEKIRKMVTMAILVAISIVLVSVIHVPLIPAVPFLEYDPADIPILIGAFAYGPVAGIILTVVTSVIQGLTVSASSGLYGIIMHIIATSVLVLVASGIYRVRHTKKGAILGLVCGTIAMALVMLPANHFITPAFMGVPTEVLDALLLPGILPFNLIKAGINSVVTFLVYKTVSRHLIHGESWKKEPNLGQAQPNEQ
ncbi:MAG TPA: ECF transporter S component [Candidatus Evtepia faecigallinarum]|nr:ECF transporter S component [Candidatus Evtepia faecigallinarum]